MNQLQNIGRQGKKRDWDREWMMERMRERKRPMVELGGHRSRWHVVSPWSFGGGVGRRCQLWDLTQDLAVASAGSLLSVVQQVHLQRLGQRKAQYPLSEDVHRWLWSEQLPRLLLLLLLLLFVFLLHRFLLFHNSSGSSPWPPAPSHMPPHIPLSYLLLVLCSSSLVVVAVQRGRANTAAGHHLTSGQDQGIAVAPVDASAFKARAVLVEASHCQTPANAE